MHSRMQGELNLDPLNVFTCTINAYGPSDPAVEDMAKTITRVVIWGYGRGRYLTNTGIMQFRPNACHRFSCYSAALVDTFFYKNGGSKEH